MIGSMTSAGGVDVALNRLARLALRATGADRCAILTSDPQRRNRLLPAAGASVHGDPHRLWERFRGMDPIEIPPDLPRPSIFDTHEVLVIEDVEHTRLIPALWKSAWGSRSVAIAPLTAGGEPFGVLAVAYVSETHRFTPGEVTLLEAIANGAGVALRSARLVEGLRVAAETERRLGECTAALRSGRSTAEILDLVADRFASLLPEASCSINLLSADRSSFRTVAHRGVAPPEGDISLGDLPPIEVASIERSWIRDPHEPIRIADVRARPGWDDVIPLEIGTGLLVPLSDGPDVLGFVAIGRSADPFTDDEVRVATAFAAHAALALTQARLTETLRVRLATIQAMQRLSDAVERSRDLKALLHVLNTEVCAEIAIECTRLSFGDGGLAEILRVPACDPREIALLRSWRRDGSGAPQPLDGDLAVPVPLAHRPAGVLRVRAAGSLDRTGLELVRAIALGLGEVAHKAKLRRTAERNAQELAVASDRERIARDLHDTVGQTLYGIGLKLQDLLCEVDDPDLRERLGSMRALASRGVADVRSAVYALSFLHVRERGFVPSLRALARQFRAATGVGANLRVHGPLPALDDDVESALYRMAHEALVNVERHARATGVVMSLRATPAAVELAIRDDGVGLDQRHAADWKTAAHFGLRTMAGSIEAVGGRFTIAQPHPRGLLLTASIPLGGSQRR